MVIAEIFQVALLMLVVLSSSFHGHRMFWVAIPLSVFVALEVVAGAHVHGATEGILVYSLGIGLVAGILGSVLLISAPDELRALPCREPSAVPVLSIVSRGASSWNGRGRAG